MESIFKVTVMFLLTFSVPASTNNENYLEHLWTRSAAEEPVKTPHEETDNFWLAGFLMLAE